MPKITIKNIEHTEKTSKAGKSYTSCRITVWSNKENKDIFISGFGSSLTKTWNPGDEIDVNLSQTESGYWNFDVNENSKPSENPTLKVLKEISAKLDILIGKDLGKITKDFGGEVVPTVLPTDPNYVDVNKITF